MTREETDVRLAAAHVLALLSEHREIVCVRLRTERRATSRLSSKALKRHYDGE
jgi:hypothetical protein